MAFLTPETVLYVNSEGYTDDNDYNRMIFKIQSKNGTTCHYDDLVYEEEKCIEHAETPKWNRIETVFKSEMEFLQERARSTVLPLTLDSVKLESKFDSLYEA